MTSTSFVHLHVHSAYSLAEGAIKLKKLVALAIDAEMPAMALTDTGNLFGALEFALLAAEAGVQPIIGTEIKLIRARSLEKAAAAAPLYDTLVLLVQTEVGYRNLLKLVSKSFMETDPAYLPHITWEDLQKHNEGLLCLSGSVGGPIARLFLEGQHGEAISFSEKLSDLFKGRFYVEMTRLGYEEEALVEDYMIKLALEKGYPLVATNNVYFSDPSMHEAHDALICIAEGRYVNEADRPRKSPHHYFKSAEEMAKLFEDIPEAIHNTTLIAKRCTYMPQGSNPLLPSFKSDSGLSEADELKKQAEEGLLKRLQGYVYEKEMTAKEKETIAEAYKKRLHYELGVITQMGFAGYFLIVSDFIKWAKKEEIPVGPGRGSGAGSLVAWSLLITDIDPIRFGLLFERFLNPERVSMPDFDVDFCQDRRDEVISYVQQKYGRDRVAQIITFGKLQARAVLRDVGRVLQLPYGQVDKICKLIPSNPANPVTLAEALEQEPELRRAQNEDPTVDKMIQIALKLEGLYRHASTHAAGIIIGDRPLDEVVPLYRDPKSSMPVTQFNMKLVEKAGLVKFDFLGLKTLTILETAAELARRKGDEVHISTLPLDDKKTFDLLKRVETTGIFQLESTGMRDVLRRLKPDRFEEIIALVALYRPGPMDDIPRYLSCKHGDEEVKYMHPLLEDVLKETFGVMVYQEQVMQIAQLLGGYSLGGADLLRRAMGKKIKEEMDAQRKIFVEGALKNNLSSTLANQIFDQMAKFAGYGFNKSHSAPYGLIAYQTAYMKANYPVEFMAATMTYDMNNTDKLNLYRQELGEMQIALLPPDVNKSWARFTVEEGAVRYALAAVKGVGEQAIDELTHERERGGAFKSLEDFLGRLSGKVVNKRLMESLIAAGAFDTIHPNRRQLFESLEELLRVNALLQQEKQNKTATLFGKGDSSPSKNLLKLKNVPSWGVLEKMQKEFDAIGFYLSAHPLDVYGPYFKNLRVVSSDTLRSYADQVVRVGGVVTDVKTRISKQGRKFAFVTLSDMAGAFETAVFSDLLAAHRELWEVGRILALDVQVRLDGDAFKLVCQNVSLFDTLVHAQKGCLLVTLSRECDVMTLVTQLHPYEGGNQLLKLLLKTESGDVTIALPKTYTLSPHAQEAVSRTPGVEAIQFI